MANKEYVVPNLVELRPRGCTVSECYHALPTEEDNLLSGLCLQVAVRESAKNSVGFFLS